MSGLCTPAGKRLSHEERATFAIRARWSWPAEVGCIGRRPGWLLQCFGATPVSPVPSRIGSAVARSLVESLGPDCMTAVVVAQHLERGTREIGNNTSLAGQAPASVERVARDFAERGWLVAIESGWRRSSETLPIGLSDFLMGASAMRIAIESHNLAETVVTLPPAPSAIARALPKEGPIHASIATTDDELNSIARSAVSSLTIMSPFVNDDGAEFALRMFEGCHAPNRLLITRMSGTTKPVVQRTLPRLKAANVRVLDYLLRSDDGFETFHAKVVIADGDLAYVGSANLTKYARHSMELGVIIRGRAARAVSALVRSVERIANPVVSG